jgi:aminoglycoside phosphotransferase (APT) family kinase protein
VHDATAGWEPPGAVWAVEPVEPREVLCHGDPGPWNMVWIDGRAVGLFDWDFCHPGPRREDVAYALEYLAPFRSDADAQRWHAFPHPPDRASRVAVFCEEYGINPEGMVDSVLEVQRRVMARVRVLADAGVDPQVAWVSEGFLDELSARVAWSERHRHLFS